MVGEAAVADAVARAKRMPNLAVGLHLTLASGHAVLPPSKIPALVDRHGCFDDDMGRAGIRYFFIPHVRRQLESEIRAQFEAFHATGLKLDHVNVHRHFHLHPTLATMVLRIGRDFGMQSVRVPFEPVSVLRQAANDRTITSPLYQPWVRMLGWRMRQAGMIVNDHILGLHWSGAMTEGRVLGLLSHLPAGLTEMYFHPANARTDKLKSLMPGYRHIEELQALTSHAVRQAVKDGCIQLVTFGQLAGQRT
jgi:hopanoid biosynthesis associated protein HpnK